MMILNFLSVLFPAFLCTTKSSNEFSKNFYLSGYHVLNNGVNPNYNFMGDFVNVTYNNRPYTQLGFPSYFSYGMVQSKNPLKRKKFQFSINFAMSGFSQGGGFSIWIGDKVNLSSDYSNVDGAKGFGLFFDNIMMPQFYYKDSNKNVGRKIFATKNTALQTIHIKYDFPKVVISNQTNGRISNEIILYEGFYKLNPLSYLTISSSTGSSTHYMKLMDIYAHTSIESLNAYVPGNVERSNTLVIFIGVVSMISLFVYFYHVKKQAQENLHISK